MKLLSILDAVGWGGTKEQAYITAMGLKNMGFDVYFALSYDFEDFKKKIENKIPYFEFEREAQLKRINVFSYKRLYDIVSKNNFDIVLANSPKALDYVRVIYPFLSRKPKIVGFKRSGRKSNIMSKYLKYKIADKIVVVSRKVYEELIQDNFFPEKLVLIPSGIDLSRFKIASHDEKMGLRKKYNLPLDKFIFINVANYNPEIKGHIDILKAYKQIENENTAMVFVGLLTDKDAKEQAKTMGIKTFYGLGYREDVEYILRACDAFVLGSRLEGVAGALLQGMATGLICISTKAGGVPEYLKHEENGFLVDIKDIESMAFHMKKVISLDDTTKEQMISKALSTAEEYSVESMLKRYKELLETIQLYS